ncbi:MAG: hypothetical protein RR355_05505, partial [Oscillospiraceae bacterium]
APVLKIPPQRLIKNEVTPLVIPAKNAFINVSSIAGIKPIDAETNIVAIFESPNFAPGGKKGVIGTKLSKKESVIATAAKIPNKEIFNVDFFI